jgi:excisionase family DNA binding protein
MLRMATDIRLADTLPELLTVPQLADYLGVPVSTIYHWRTKGQGPPGFKLGKRVAFRAGDVARWLDECSPTPHEMREPGSGRAEGSRGDDRAQDIARR